MNYKLRGTNVIAIELIADEENFDIEDIKKFILEKKQLLRGTRFILSVENRVLSEEELRDLVEFLKNVNEFIFCGLKTNLKENRELCIKLGIPCDISTLEIEKEKERSESEEIKFYGKTLRSGDKLTSSGDLIIMGDVNPGSEVEAGGNVYVMGNLMGFVRAGIGKSEAEVRAIFFKAPVLEICGRTVSFERNEEYLNFRVRVKNGKVKIEHKSKGK
ncbi:septum site-determining protein MinC [Balnearium lithotrophicum]|uniref:Probable septum site-determining protein MinC n=1 Tax=Balnearium lithotrophicum TaxID=223788 RepID=A0A521CV38_9BACT|nr:septum site-determining protein MinC [Balnearium lithotrophicum]SMO63306.1 septum site-determining protein MinC [Balnearium lithotrophicum]